MAIFSGFVVDPDGDGLDNATFIAGDQMTLCTSDGSFSLADVAMGQCPYKIVHRDYPVARGIIDIDGDSCYLFQMTRRRSPGSAPKSGILDAKREIETALVGMHESVVGVGVTPGRDSIVVYVRGDIRATPDRLDVPDAIGGYPIQIVPATTDARPPVYVGAAPRTRHRPVCGGVSAAHHETPAGTLGAIVYDRETRGPRFLSNNHVFAQCSSDVSARASVGDPILQPSSMDGGGSSDVVGTLDRWVPYRVRGKNYVDAAIATPGGAVAVDPRILINGEMVRVAGTRPVSSRTRVKICGRTSGCGWGDVVDWDFSTVMTYPTGERIIYSDQLLITLPVEEGDSGALLLDEDNYAIGLLSGVVTIDGERYAVANKIRNVLELLDVEVY